jgi:hypothetical protein
VKRCAAVGVGVGVVAMICAATAKAEPAVPQSDSACSARVADAFTQSVDHQTVLRCQDGPAGYRWRSVEDPYLSSDRWLTYGPALTLDGEARRNRELDAGDWTGYPLDIGDRCTANQVAVAASGGAATPVMSTGKPDRPLTLRLLPQLLSVELGGYCLWQKG